MSRIVEKLTATYDRLLEEEWGCIQIDVAVKIEKRKRRIGRILALCGHPVF